MIVTVIVLAKPCEALSFNNAHKSSFLSRGTCRTNGNIDSDLSNPHELHPSTVKDRQTDHGPNESAGRWKNLGRTLHQELSDGTLEFEKFKIFETLKFFENSRFFEIAT